MNDTLETLRRRYPETPFLALGQTALWDEPTKAVLRRRLDSVWPEARMVAAAHDTDYFAKLPGHPATAGDSPFALVPHDDAATRGLWSAAGEMSRLLGSEDVATRAQLARQGGVSLHRVLSFTDDPAVVLSELTAAWGWTGIIHTGWERRIVADIRLRDLLPILLEQIDWATGGSADCLRGARREAAGALRATLRAWIEAFADAHPDASLPALYRDLFPRLYGLLLGAPPRHLSTSRTTELLRFNRSTAAHPRFALVDLFLRPATRPRAEASYNRAVAGTDVYTLDQFGEDALPFDLVVPERGRGTLRVSRDGAVTIDTPQPIALPGAGPIHGIEALAGQIEEALGPDCTLIGKAITLLPMLCADHLLVFHEGASGYTDRTRQMMAEMAERGVSLPPLHPIVRLRYRTWEALAAAAEQEEAILCLPEFLRQALGRPQIAFADFADCWPRAIQWERERLAEIARLRTPRALLGYLIRTAGPVWSDRAAAYRAATETLLALRTQGAALQAQVETLYEQGRVLRQEAVAIEREKGEDFRRRGPDLSPEAVAERARRFDERIAQRRARVREILSRVRALKAERLALERSPETVAARLTLRRIEADAERERARQVRNALQTIHGLPHTNFRPSAWWFPLVDPSGAWFDRLAQTAEIYLEPLAAER